MPTFGNGRNNSKTTCIRLHRVRFPKLGHPAFQHRKHEALASPTTCRDSASCGIARRRSWHCFPSPFNVMKWSLAEGTSVCRFKSMPTWGLLGLICAVPERSAMQRGPCLQSPARVFVLLSCVSGEIYLRLKPYLVVKISFDVVTEHCCQVCVFSMMFCHSDCRLWACGGKWLRNQETPRSITWTTYFDFTPTGQRGIWKIFFTCDLHILP